MSEEIFWRCTPRKLFSLLDVHVKVNSSDENGGGTHNQKQAIDAVASW
jgi:hypothetical protein